MEELHRRKPRLDSPPAQPALSAMTLLLRACDLEMIGFRLIPCVSSMLRIGAKSARRNRGGVEEHVPRRPKVPPPSMSDTRIDNCGSPNTPPIVALMRVWSGS